MNFLLEIKEGLGIAWTAIHANKLRSVLTTLGIVIGIVTVTLMGTAIEGMNRAFRKSISFIGADTLYLSRETWFADNETDWLKSRKRRYVTLEQARALANSLTTVLAVAPTVNTMQSVSYKTHNASGVFVLGTTDQYLITAGLSLEQGRFMTEAEADGGRPVCVIGVAVATNLFGLESALGKRIKVGPRSLDVIGVLEKRGSFLGIFSLDNEVIVPLGQFVRGYQRNPDFQIEIKAARLDQVEDTKEEVRGIFRKIRRLDPGEADDFSINQQEQFLKMFNRVAGTLAAAGLVITGLSLFVGGIGIMNIMFVSVAERTREIGVRKAIGARRRNILTQFLIEAATLCGLGGLVGLFIAYLLTFALARVIPATMSLSVAGLAILVSLLTGLIAGFLPAWRAARMNPVDALRNE